MAKKIIPMTETPLFYSSALPRCGLAYCTVNTYGAVNFLIYPLENSSLVQAPKLAH